MQISRSRGTIHWTCVGELLDRFRSALQSRGSAFLVVLDEIDALVKRSEDDSLLYELTRINEKLTDGWIGLIGISNDLHFKDFLDPRVLSSLGEEEVVFNPTPQTNYMTF